jgi:hypothetical protein
MACGPLYGKHGNRRAETTLPPASPAVSASNVWHAIARRHYAISHIGRRPPARRSSRLGRVLAWGGPNIATRIEQHRELPLVYPRSPLFQIAQLTIRRAPIRRTRRAHC